MHIRLLAVGDRQPGWVEAAFKAYVARMPRHWQFRLEAIGTAQRSRNASSDTAKAVESEKILAKIKPADFVVALDERGKQFDSRSLAAHLDEWQAAGQDIVFVIGGPDGFSKTCLQRANLQWSLSMLTLPHGLARVFFAEQIYRAWTIQTGHPYHRD